MAQATKSLTQKSHVVKITGITEELLGMLDDRVRQRHATGRSEYIRELLRRDLLGDAGPSLRQILAPVHEQGRTITESDEELDSLFDSARDEVYKERRQSRSQQ